ncbi:MAG TPA: hypothetical protein VK601_14710, partial [Kofleriaceae bacterium]|nr:hypothetical protein [Kofleriaceae bacterium]
MRTPLLGLAALIACNAKSAAPEAADQAAMPQEIADKVRSAAREESDGKGAGFAKDKSAVANGAL